MIRTRVAVPFLLSAFASVTCLPGIATAQAPSLKGLDPIALCAGKEQAGKPEFVARHEGYVYHFATRQRLEQFRKQPARWSIQLGGGCARMGPLTGNGDPNRYHVYKGRIYIFASDGCRVGFTKNPDACLARHEPPPKTAGKPGFDATETLNKARLAHGVNKSFAGLSYETLSDQGATTVLKKVAVRDHRSVRVETVYKQGATTWTHAQVTSPQDSFFVGDGAVRSMSSAGSTEMRTVMWQEPLVALSACQKAVRGKKAKVASVDVTEISIWIDGTLTHFGLDRQHRVRTARFRGRSPDQRFGEIIRVFDDFTTIAGVTVPQTVHTMWQGKEVPSLLEKRTKIRVGKPAAHQFRRPAGK